MPWPRTSASAACAWATRPTRWTAARRAGSLRLTVVRRGPRVHPLPAGTPIAALESGGAGARQLEGYIADHKVAGIVVLHNGKIRLERYAMHHSAAGKWLSFSVAKSMTSTLVGAALKDGYIASIEDPVTRYVPGIAWQRV